jgi:plasmid maintenance system killer protein
MAEAPLRGQRSKTVAAEPTLQFWSVTVTGNWRIIFRFEDGNAFDVDLIDCH